MTTIQMLVVKSGLSASAGATKIGSLDFPALLARSQVPCNTYKYSPQCKKLVKSHTSPSRGLSDTQSSYDSRPQLLPQIMQQSERSSALTHRSRSSTVPDAIVGDRRAKRSRTSQIPANSQDEDAEGRQDSDGILERTHKSRTRVVIACKTCRARKTKCDGGQPKCSFCTRINGVCEYDDPEFGHASYVVIFH